MAARLPSLNGLRAFEAAARHMSFTLAASELNVTQTAISHQIRRLEEEPGVRLSIRQNRALSRTPGAKAYLPGIRAEWLMDGELLPAGSPAVRKGEQPVDEPGDLAEHVPRRSGAGNDDDGRVRLPAAGLPPDLPKQPGVTVDLVFVALPAGIDG